MMIALTPRIPICRTAQYFNPHFRKGSDGVGTVVPLDANYFNPHFRKGSDYMGQRVQWWVWHFNPHFRKGSDVRTATVEIKRINFNPHFRKGSDRKLQWPDRRPGISIHTSAREVTITNPTAFNSLPWFQSTLPQGKWRVLHRPGKSDHAISIHTSAREVTIRLRSV